MATALADILVSRFGAHDQALDAIEAELRRAIADVEVRTSARVAPERFAAHVARWIRPDERPLDALAALRLDQLYLTCAAADGQPAAIAAIEADHFARARAALGSFDRTAADEALQRMRALRFVARADRPPRIAEFAGRGELSGWIRTTALREAFAVTAPVRSGREVRDDALDGYALPAADPALELMKREYGASFKQALAAALAALPEATRLALRRYYIEGLGLEQMAALEGVAASTISRRLERARRELHDETRRALGERLRVADEELDSILRLLDSRLELSRGALAGGA